MDTGTIAHGENKWGYTQFKFVTHLYSIAEIGFSLFDSFVVVNSFIAWRNHVLKGRPEKERAWKKYGIREARLQLITRWAKRCSRHYQKTQPHKNKRMRLVTYKNFKSFWVVSWKVRQSSHRHRTMMRPSRCQDQAVVLYVVQKQSFAVGGVVWISKMCSLCAPHQSEIVYGRCMNFETKFEYLKDMNTTETNYHWCHSFHFEHFLYLFFS